MNKIAILIVSAIVGFALFYQPSELKKVSEQPTTMDTLDSMQIAERMATFAAEEDSLRLKALRDLESLDVESVVVKLAEGNLVEDERIGIAGSLSRQWVRFEHLKKIASHQELVALTRHKNAVVRCYAFRALVDRHSSKVFPVLLQHLHDTARIRTRSGCTGLNMQTRAYFIMAIKLTPKQQATVSRLLPEEIPVGLY